MTRGARRLSAATVTAIVSDSITHFGYFQSRAGRSAILAAIAAPPEGTIADRGGVVPRERPEGVRVSRARDPGSLPVCIFLPGIMGSHLHHDAKWIWANPIRMATGGLERLRMPGDGVAPGEMMERYYGDLARFLSRSHDVILFPYDWRRDPAPAARNGWRTRCARPSPPRRSRCGSSPIRWAGWWCAR